MYNLAQILESIKLIVSLAGAAVIIIGALEGLYQFFMYLFKIKKINLDNIRLELGQKIVLGLEFILAGDCIITIFTPDYYELGLLAILVIIRTILSYFLNNELEELTPEARKKIV